jgi:DNA-binding CsgD family transcriptional regulator
MAKKSNETSTTQRAKPGRPPSGLAPSKNVLLRLYAEEEKSIREIAESLNCTKDMVARALKAYGIAARPNASRSRLRTIELAILEGGVREKGIRGYARELGVTEGTLRHHLKARKSPPYTA